MSRFTGPQGKGALRAYRETKRAEAEARNANSNPAIYMCRHVHGEAAAQKCEAAA
jgi:hypothetical protein